MRIAKIVELLREEVGGTRPVIGHSNAFQVLIATILSQRTRDEQTAKASTRLFAKYPGARALSRAPLKSVEKLIKPVGFYRQKAKKTKKTAQILVEKYSGKVPRDMEMLLELPGVGRKTANCVLVYAFQKPAIPVDVHVHRITNRWGLANTKTPEETEQELAKVLPKKYWIEINQLLVKFGQKKCFPRTPNCAECSLQKYCNYYKHL